MNDGRDLGTGRVRPLGRLFCVLAGCCDLATGLGLVAAPGHVLAWMGVALVPGPMPDETSVYVRFIGAFVAGVGASYLYPLVLDALRTGGTGGPPGRLPAVIEVTALVRTGVALFVTAAVVTGALTAPWLSVAATDAVLAALQLWLLSRGVFGRA